MGFIVGFLKKIIGVREIFLTFYVVFSVAYIASAVAFSLFLISKLLEVYNLIRDLFDMHNSVLAGTDLSGQNYGDVALAMLDAYGLIHVYETFLPLYFSTVTGYLAYFGLRVLLSLKSELEKVIRGAGLMIGS